MFIREGKYFSKFGTGSKSLTKHQRIIPLSVLSRHGKNRRKRHKRKFRRTAFVHLTDLA